MDGCGLQAPAETPEEPAAQAASLPQLSTSRAAQSKEQPGAIPKGESCSCLVGVAQSLAQSQCRSKADGCSKSTGLLCRIVMHSICICSWCACKVIITGLTVVSCAGFFADKDADAKARGEDKKKKSKEEQFSDFMTSIAADVQEV